MFLQQQHNQVSSGFGTSMCVVLRKIEINNEYSEQRIGFDGIKVPSDFVLIGPHRTVLLNSSLYGHLNNVQHFLSKVVKHHCVNEICRL